MAGQSPLWDHPVLLVHSTCQETEAGGQELARACEHSPAVPGQRQTPFTSTTPPLLRDSPGPTHKQAPRQHVLGGTQSGLGREEGPLLCPEPHKCSEASQRLPSP